MTRLQRLGAFRELCVPLLASELPDTEIYPRLLEMIAREMKVSFAVGHRLFGDGRYRSTVYPRDLDIHAYARLVKTSWFKSSGFNRHAPPIASDEKLLALYLFSETSSIPSPLYVLYLGAAEGKPWSSEDEQFSWDLCSVLPPMLSLRHELVSGRLEHQKLMRERREVSEELRHLFDESRDMIYTTNAEDRIASINPAGLILLNTEDRFDLIGRNFCDFLSSPEDRDFFLGRIRKQGFIQDHEFILKGDVFCLETAHALVREDGSFAGVQGIIKDISDRIDNERNLWVANMELVEANQELQKTQSALIQQEKLASIGYLAAGVAHEINNPLGFLKSSWGTLQEYVQTLKNAFLEAEQPLSEDVSTSLRAKHDVDFILKDLDTLFAQSGDGFTRIIEIVSQLKAFSRVDKDTHLADFNIEEGIRSTLIVARNEIKYVADVKLLYCGVSPVEADGSALNQVFLNIIVNAAQAIASQKRKDRGLITITTNEDAGMVRVSISDDGPGMSKEVVDQIFTPFFTMKEPGKGTGLGLSISWDIIVNKHHGALKAESEPGKGTTMCIKLPLKQPEAKLKEVKGG